MTVTTAASLTGARLPDLRAIDFRSADRDFWADEAALWRRFVASWAGLDDRAWRLPGAAPSDAGGPDWSLLDHVAHVADWQEIAIGYVTLAVAGGPWPSDDDFEGGDFDRFNEARRGPWAGLRPGEIVRRLLESHDRLLGLTRPLPMTVIRSDAAWGWVHMVLHGHTLDHLGIIEPWAHLLRDRQADGDPLGPDPRLGIGDEATDAAAFHDEDEAVFRMLDEVLETIPDAAWSTGDVTPGWSVRDHVAHLADWFEECVRVVGVARESGAWEDDPPEGIDAWNARMVARSATASRREVMERYRTGRERLRAAAATLTQAELRTPEAWDWIYHCLHGHARKHLARIGPFAATIATGDA